MLAQLPCSGCPNRLSDRRCRALGFLSFRTNLGWLRLFKIHPCLAYYSPTWLACIEVSCSLFDQKASQQLFCPIRLNLSWHSETQTFVARQRDWIASHPPRELLHHLRFVVNFSQMNFHLLYLGFFKMPLYLTEGLHQWGETLSSPFDSTHCRSCVAHSCFRYASWILALSCLLMRRPPSYSNLYFVESLL